MLRKVIKPAAPDRVLRHPTFNSRVPPRGALAMLASQADGSAAVQRLARLQSNAAAGQIAQFYVSRKGSGESERTKGKASALRDQVDADIATGDWSEISFDITVLKTSIKNRKRHQESFPSGTPEYQKHAGRITLEEVLLQRLYQKRSTLVKPQAPKTKTAPKMPANMFELLM